MTVELNHTIIWCRDKARSASFLAEILGRSAPREVFHFLVVDLDNHVSLDFMETSGQVAMQHYAFKLDRASFDAAFARIRERKLTWWGDPARRRVRETYLHQGDEGLYFEDPDGHFLEIIAPA